MIVTERRHRKEFTFVELRGGLLWRMYGAIVLSLLLIVERRKIVLSLLLIAWLEWLVTSRAWNVSGPYLDRSVTPTSVSRRPPARGRMRRGIGPRRHRKEITRLAGLVSENRIPRLRDRRWGRAAARVFRFQRADETCLRLESKSGARARCSIARPR